MTTIFLSPVDLLEHIASAAKNKRLALNLSQQNLASRSQVSLSVIKKFEHCGKISLESLLKIALVLDSLNEFTALFKAPDPLAFATMDELLRQKKRKRGRK